MSHLLGGSGRAVSTLNGFSHAPNAVRGIDPRARIIGSVVFAVTVVALHQFVALAAAVGASVLVMATARMPIRRTLKRMIAMDSFIIFMLAMLPFTVPGEAMFHVFGFPASWEGFLQAARIALKANAIVLMLMALVGTMESTTLCHSLYRLRTPDTLVHLLMFTVRYIDVLHQEYQRLRTAMKARGFRPQNSRHTYVSFGYLVGMMLVRAMERSERVLAAMKCRGFSGQIHVIDHLTFSVRDVWFSAIGASTVVALLSVEWAYAVAY
ncbi:cobalt ECF transporter T component CbiQ [Magnetovibrio sp. PR-2]|uniref:cobalt ECF transporter T component CbiQ n=1 Tax=Magnetovibrio sp. PR-2 TaxID=3120356 RepID=UPI002FCE0287